MMTDWYERSTKALQLAGLAKSSEQSYTRMVRMLVDFYGKTPDLVSEAELQDYLLHRRNVDKWSAATLRICYSALKFFFEKVLQREWHIFGYLKAERPKTLPAVLSKEEITELLSKVRTPHNRAYFSTVYSCGLRLQEALTWKWATSTATGCSSMFIAARGQKTAWCRFPLPPSPRCETTGKRIVIPGSYSRLEVC